MTTHNVIEFYDLPDAADESDPDPIVIASSWGDLTSQLSMRGINVDHYEYIDNDGMFTRYNAITTLGTTPGIAIANM